MTIRKGNYQIMHKLLLILTLLFLTSACATLNDKQFKTGVSKANRIYTSPVAREKIKNLATKGKTSELIKFMELIVPNKEKTFFDYFILGNMLFSLDREASYQYMRKAEEGIPRLPIHFI